jgi:hypothetical protein
MATQFEVTIRCDACGRRYKRKMFAASEEALEMLPDPPCPDCKKAKKQRGMKVSDGKAPAVGGSQHVRAVDYTAEMVMKEQGMTDLRDDVREGETMAPKLPHRLQQQADNFFVGAGKARARIPMGQLMNSAQAGSVVTPTGNPDPIAQAHADRRKPAINYVN